LSASFFGDPGAKQQAPDSGDPVVRVVSEERERHKRKQQRVPHPDSRRRCPRQRGVEARRNQREAWTEKNRERERRAADSEEERDLPSGNASRPVAQEAPRLPAVPEPLGEKRRGKRAPSVKHFERRNEPRTRSALHRAADEVGILADVAERLVEAAELVEEPARDKEIAQRQIRGSADFSRLRLSLMRGNPGTDDGCGDQEIRNTLGQRRSAGHPVRTPEEIAPGRLRRTDRQPVGAGGRVVVEKCEQLARGEVRGPVAPNRGVSLLHPDPSGEQSLDGGRLDGGCDESLERRRSTLGRKRPEARREILPGAVGSDDDGDSDAAHIRIIDSTRSDERTRYNPEKVEAERLYRWMRLNRTVEERLSSLYRQGKIHGGLYRSLGQEATSVGSAAALSDGDILGPLIRNLGSVLVRGFRPREIFEQYLGRATGPSAGKDGTLHFSSIERGVIGSIAMLGELVPVMAGAAMAVKRLGRNAVCLTYIGDGGTSTGPFHEGMNFASVLKLPLVVIGENNHWAYSTPLSQQMACGSLADRALAYGIPSATIDGNDVEVVHAATAKAVARAREGGGPTFIEAVTYRMKGHAEHDPQEYVDPEELERWRARDPLATCARRLRDSGQLTEEQLATIDSSVEREVEEDLAAAERAPAPRPESALEGVYAGSVVSDETPIIRFAEDRR
jgi:TPP-dependent pyruvate/acetoin dehydrogenase alpha subunit